MVDRASERPAERPRAPQTTLEMDALLAATVQSRLSVDLHAACERPEFGRTPVTRAQTLLIQKWSRLGDTWHPFRVDLETGIVGCGSYSEPGEVVMGRTFDDTASGTPKLTLRIG
jgi:hypothetical protein